VRSAVLAYLAGVGAFQRRVDKAEAVLEEVERRRREGGQRLSETKQNEAFLASVAAGQEGKISSIREQLAGQQVTRAALMRDLQEAGIPVDLGAIPPEDTDALSALVRGACSERVALYEARLRLLAEIEAMSLAHSSRLQQSESLLQNITNARSRQQALLNEENAAAQKLQDLERQIGELEPRISAQQVWVNLLRQLQDLQRKQVELERSLAAGEQQQQKIHNDLIILRDSLERLDSDVVQLAHDEGACQQRGQRLLSELLNLTVLPHEIPSYPNLTAVAVNQTVRIHTLGRALDSLANRKTELEAQLQSVEQRLNEANQRVAQTRASVEEAAGLVSRLRQYATSKECPLCGHPYPTVSVLQEAIDVRLSTIPDGLRRMAAELQSLIQEKAGLAATVETSRQQLEEWQNSLQTVHQERDEALRVIGSALEQRNRAVEETKSALRLVQEQVRALQTEAVGQLPTGDLAIALRASESQLTTLESKRTELITLREGVRNQWSSHQNGRLNVEQSLGQWQESATQIAGEIQAYRTKCLQLELAEDAPVDSLISARTEISEKLSVLQSIQKMADQYALSCKLATIEGEQNQSRSQLENAQKTGEQITKEMRALENADREIKRWIALLSEHVNRAVTDRIMAHKSEINSLFKAMIPTPYLFDEVTMSQVGDGLSLGLRYRGQVEDVGEPQFFLSNAQANVLALSLFLSFTRAQRWAKLETILLDDPVQHLDDLDAVAFLDTLRSVVLGGFGPKKQVIVSTCDQNLYLLMIRKFGMLESMGLRFTGISLLDRGEAGPEILYDIGGA
jgi:DNA repair exonuclease SbcCD ATPase subunit